MLNRYRTQLILASIVALFVLVVPQVSLADGVVEDLLYNLVVALFGMLVYLGAMILNSGINYFVIGFGGTFNNSGIGVAVNDTWAIIRDFVNLFFIFGLVYIGIKMVLGSDDSNARRWLANLVLAALLVNFSLFATKFVVDFSNRISAEIAVAGLGATPKGNDMYESDVGGKLMQRMGITSVFKYKELNKNQGMGYIFGTAILFMVAAFVFAAGGFLLIIRFAVLMMFLILSPVMFASWIVPGIQDTMKKYWKMFLSRAFFAPIYFVFLYFAFQMMDGLQRSVGANGTGNDFANPNWAGALSSNPAEPRVTTLGTLSFFVLICVFLIGSLKAANSIGADGASRALSIGKSLSNKAQGYTKRGAGAATTGAAASLGRNTLGRRGNMWANDADLKMRAQQGGLSGMRARAKLATGNYMAGASFDARQVGGVGKSLGVGEGAKGGYKKRLEDDAKKAKKYADGLGTVDIDSEEGKARVKAEQERIKTEAKKKEAMANGARDAFNESYNNAAGFSDETTKRKAALAKLEDDLRTGNADRTLTTREREELEAKIKNQQLDIRKREQAAEARARVQAERNKYIAASSATRGYRGTDAAEKTRLKDLEEKAKAAWDKQEADELAAFDAQAAAATAEHNGAESKAKASIKYERQIAFMERQRRSANNWSSPLANNGTTAGILVGALTAGVGGAAYGVVGAKAVRAKSESYENIVKELEKEYGRDGSKKMKKDSNKKAAKELMESIKESAGEDTSATKSGAENNTPNKA